MHLAILVTEVHDGLVVDLNKYSYRSAIHIN